MTPDASAVTFKDLADCEMWPLTDPPPAEIAPRLADVQARVGSNPTELYAMLLVATLEGSLNFHRCLMRLASTWRSAVEPPA
jgi:hypothetical protein